MFDECKGDKFEFIKRIQEMASETKQRVDIRLPYEQTIMSIWSEGKSLEEEKMAWQRYIAYEISNEQLQRAKLLYERALISLDKDNSFWMQYVQFIEKYLKDATFVRAKFENRLKHCHRTETVDIMIENALFEED